MDASFVFSKDYPAVLRVNSQLGDCRSREELNQILISLLPLLDCSGAFYARLEGQYNTPHILENINQSFLCHCRWENFLHLFTQTKQVGGVLETSGALPLVADTFSLASNTCQKCSNDSGDNHNRGHFSCSTVGLYDAPNPAVALFLCRFTQPIQTFSARDFKLMQFLRGTLLQTVKAVLYKEEHSNLQNILKCLCDSPDPLAVICDEGVLVHKTHSFDQLVGHDDLKKIFSLITKMITPGFNGSLPDCIQSQLGRRLYNINITTIPAIPGSDQHLYLLRINRSSDKKHKIIRKFSSAGLTRRELDIAALIYQGTSTRNISEQLNVSYHTVRNHIKRIYSKTGVSSRSELLVWAG